MDLEITRKQEAFINSTAYETLFGGAAGGGKSYVQLIDALLYALKYPKSKQLILRRTFPELEKSLIRVSLDLYPRNIYRYNDSKHTGRFKNGSIIDFGYCDNESDVFKYQSAEYDAIRFDELTHFTEQMYLYITSRCRGANDYPKMIKSSTNPGHVGHVWVKARFIDIAPANTLYECETGSRLFIPSKVQDNRFLMQKDPEYLKRLLNLSGNDRKALLDGDWDIFEGQYFSEFNRDIHVCEPFPVPEGWKWYFTMDYGFDMAALYWIAVDEHKRAYVVREYCQGKDNNKDPLIISEAAQKINQITGEIMAVTDRQDTEGSPIYDSIKISQYLAPPDLWNKRQETGKSVADIFWEHKIPLTKTSNRRIDGWLAVKEWLKPFTDETGSTIAKLTIFSTCTELIRCIPALQHDEKDPSDVATNPHEITHSPDAIRGFCVYWTTPASTKPGKKAKWTEDMYEDYYRSDNGGKERLIERWGNPW